MCVSQMAAIRIVCSTTMLLRSSLRQARCLSHKRVDRFDNEQLARLRMGEQKEQLVDKVIALVSELYIKRLDPFLAKRETVTNQEIWDLVVQVIDSVPTLKRKPAVAEEFARWLYNCTIKGL